MPDWLDSGPECLSTLDGRFCRLDKSGLSPLAGVDRQRAVPGTGQRDRHRVPRGRHAQRLDARLLVGTASPPPPSLSHTHTHARTHAHTHTHTHTHTHSHTRCPMPASGGKPAAALVTPNPKGFWVLGSGFWFLGSGFWFQASGFRVQVLGAGFWVLGSKFRVLRSGFRVLLFSPLPGAERL